jgi:4-diphosphocytidyl-2-C-methyl-D-erythritol kinase
VLAPGKVNLCLLVGAPRADGLHPLVSVVQPVDLADELTLAAAGEAVAAGGGGVAAGGGAVPGAALRDIVVCPSVPGENLAARALALFREATGWDAPPLRLTITKRIPIAAGMAGGSTDAAAALRLASQASGLPIPPDLPMRLGADVTVMLDPRRALMTAAGEHVEPLAGDKPPLIIVPLDAELGAREVYRAFDAHFSPRTPEELEEAADAIRAGRFDYVNDLEGPARRLCPAIDPALEALRSAGVQHPMVTGSGPTVFGIGDGPDAVQRLRAAGYPRAVAA